MQKSLTLQVSLVASAGSLASATPIPMAEFDGGVIYVPAAASTLTSITWHASYDGTNYFPLNSSVPAAITQTVAHTNAYHFNPSCNPVHFLKGVGNVAATVFVTLKRMG